MPIYIDDIEILMNGDQTSSASAFILDYTTKGTDGPSTQVGRTFGSGIAYVSSNSAMTYLYGDYRASKGALILSGGETGDVAVGGYFPLLSTFSSANNKAILIHFAAIQSEVNEIRLLQNTGIIIGLHSGPQANYKDNYRSFHLFGRDCIPYTLTWEQGVFVIHPEFINSLLTDNRYYTNGQVAQQGTFDKNDITGISIINGTLTNWTNQLFIGRILKIAPIIITGSSTEAELETKRASLESVIYTSDDFNIRWNVPVKIGKQGEATNFDSKLFSNGKTWIFPHSEEDEFTDKSRYAHVPNSFVWYDISNLQVGDAYNFSDTILQGSPYDVNLDCNVNDNFIHSGLIDTAGVVTIGSAMAFPGTLSNFLRADNKSIKIDGGKFYGTVYQKSEKTIYDNVTIDHLILDYNKTSDIVFRNNCHIGHLTNLTTNNADINYSLENSLIDNVTETNGKLTAVTEYNLDILEMPTGYEYNVFIEDNTIDQIGEKVLESEAHIGGTATYTYGLENVGKTAIIQIWDDAARREKYFKVKLLANNFEYIINL